jgi:hypothetical protein
VFIRVYRLDIQILVDSTVTCLCGFNFTITSGSNKNSHHFSLRPKILSWLLYQKQIIYNFIELYHTPLSANAQIVLVMGARSVKTHERIRKKNKFCTDKSLLFLCIVFAMHVELHFLLEDDSYHVKFQFKKKKPWTADSWYIERVPAYCM